MEEMQNEELEEADVFSDMGKGDNSVEDSSSSEDEVELVKWGNRRVIICLSVFQRKEIIFTSVLSLSWQGCFLHAKALGHSCFFLIFTNLILISMIIDSFSSN